MGVPAFFRWLSKKYPKIIVDAICEKGALVGEGQELFVDTSTANPNGIEFDNLYLDMNGIIHPCCHPESGAAPATEEAMVEAIFRYIDHLFCIVRPRKLLFMAIDGVAPRAKMNQQRSRRFRSAQESREKAAIEARMREEMIREGRPLPPEKGKGWDSNVITPGTGFMEKVANGVRWYINDRMARDPGWKKLKVILTTAAVPGEGEHKIMDFIRRQKAAAGYDPQTRHCIYGLDADLIMLSLAMHEAFFSVIREVVFFGGGGGDSAACFRCGRPGHKAFDCPGETAATPPVDGDGALAPVSTARKPFQFLHTHVLKEYLEHALKVDVPFGFDLESAIDDWVFMCFFVGNDFLPHLPTLEIREGAIDTMTALYRRILPQMGGYITHDGDVSTERALMLLGELARLEDSILQKRRQDDIRRRAREQQQQQQQQQQDGGEEGPPPTKISAIEPEIGAADMAFTIARAMRRRLEATGAIVDERRRKQSKAPDSEATEGGRKQQQEEEEEDQIRLGEMGWKERYYKVKFKEEESKEGEGFEKKLSEEYMKGLKWVMKYYYQGCCSWSWYFPYHYSPFACDLVKNIDAKTFEPRFEVGEPFRPFEQLMAVLPAASGHCLPESYRDLMTSPTSPIIDFYPETFAVDLNGKKFAWQGVAILPFIDEKRLLAAIAEREATLTAEEAARNARHGPTLIFVPSGHPLAPTFSAMYLESDGHQKLKRSLDPEHSGGLFGMISPLAAPLGQRAGTRFEGPWHGLHGIAECALFSSAYESPTYPPGFVFAARLPRGAILPPRSLRENELWISSSSSGAAAAAARFIGDNSATLRMVNQPTGWMPSNQYHDHRNPFRPPGMTGARDTEERRERSADYHHHSHSHSHSHEREEEQHHSHGHHTAHLDGHDRINSQQTPTFYQQQQQQVPYPLAATQQQQQQQQQQFTNQGWYFPHPQPQGMRPMGMGGIQISMPQQPLRYMPPMAPQQFVQQRPQLQQPAMPFPVQILRRPPPPPPTQLPMAPPAWLTGASSLPSSDPLPPGIPPSDPRLR